MSGKIDVKMAGQNCNLISVPSEKVVTVYEGEQKCLLQKLWIRNLKSNVIVFVYASIGDSYWRPRLEIN